MRKAPVSAGFVSTKKNIRGCYLRKNIDISFNEMI